MASTSILVSIVVALIAVALGAAYSTGAFDPIIEQIGIMIFKAEAKAEEKKLEAQGMKEGEDFLSSKFLFLVLQRLYLFIAQVNSKEINTQMMLKMVLELLED